MKYFSTRNTKNVCTAAQAIKKGISEEGGLFVPETLPAFSVEDIVRMSKTDYAARAYEVLSRLLTDFTEEELKDCIYNAYTEEKFGKNPAPVKKLNDKDFCLELWHGPTSAFKDMALQILPRFIVTALRKTGETRKALILVATSGDTGKAALEGFRDVDGTGIIVFYPANGVSKIQQLQMITQEGENVFVGSVKGNFDDCQNGVKAIFTDAEMQKYLDENQAFFSSANSINWGRLVPQIVYYFSAYCDLLNAGEITAGEKINFAVPTGNFGNILAAYYARKMGLPINRLICASNMNNVLTDFINTGKYDRKREFYKTVSPSMDILISSNLERLLFDILGSESDKLCNLMEGLSSQGEYTVDGDVLNSIQNVFYGGFATESQTVDCIKDTFEKYGYLCDTHTAVALHVLREYREKTGDTTVTVAASTASPFKFPAAVLGALDRNAVSGDEFAVLKTLSDKTLSKIPPALENLKGKTIRFETVCEKAEMGDKVKSALNAVLK